jgi:hypothetical protein
MRNVLLAIGVFGLLTAAVPYLEEVVHAATCTGANPCNACKNCKYCKRCAKDGLTCGVCRKR